MEMPKNGNLAQWVMRVLLSVTLALVALVWANASSRLDHLEVVRSIQAERIAKLEEAVANFKASQTRIEAKLDRVIERF